MRMHIDLNVLKFMDVFAFCLSSAFYTLHELSWNLVENYKTSESCQNPGHI